VRYQDLEMEVRQGVSGGKFSMVVGHSTGGQFEENLNISLNISFHRGHEG